MEITPHLPTNSVTPRADDQMIAIALARALVQRMDPPANLAQTLGAMADMVGRVNRDPHKKSLIAELIATSDDVHQDIANHEDVDQLMTCFPRWGESVIKSGLITLGAASASVFKEDKAVNKAINLLNEAIRKWVPKQTLAPGVAHKISHLLRDLPTQEGKHLQALFDTFNEYASPEDVAAAQVLLQNAGRL